MAPDSVTIYQMELPYNTTFSKELTVIGQDEPGLAIADWPTKRAWVGTRSTSSTPPGTNSPAPTRWSEDAGPPTAFVYRDSLWHGADMFGTGVASFGHVHGVHFQNVDRWEDYVGRMLDRGELPLNRALPVTRPPAADPRDDPATQDRQARRGATSAASSRRTSSPSSPTAGGRWPSGGC